MSSQFDGIWNIEIDAPIGKQKVRLAISTTPAGSMISVDGIEVGASPLTVAGPCARRRVDVA